MSKSNKIAVYKNFLELSIINKIREIEKWSLLALLRYPAVYKYLAKTVLVR